MKALGVTWPCERLSSYLQFTLITDHKPLVPLLSTSGLDNLPPRILRFGLSPLRFSFTIVHIPGKNLVNADALSIAPLACLPLGGALKLEKEAEVFVDCDLLAADKRLEEIKLV